MTWLRRLGIPASLAWGFPGVLLFMLGEGIDQGFLSAYLADHGVSTQSIAVLFTVRGVAVGVASWLSGALSDLWGPRRVMWLGSVIWVVFQVLFLAVALPTLSFPLLLVSFALRGFGFPLFAFAFLTWITAATPEHRLGRAVGWFYFCYVGGLLVFGALSASVLVPLLGTYPTLWFALACMLAGGAMTLLLVREPSAPASGENPVGVLFGSVSILWRNWKVGVGAVVRCICSSAYDAYPILMPIFFTQTIGFSLTEWLRLSFVMCATTMVCNLVFGAVGDRFGWRRTIAWFGGVGCAVTVLLLYYVPLLAGQQYALALLAAALNGAPAAAYAPLSALVPALAPGHKGQAMAALNLGAGASMLVGPAIVAVFFGVLGMAGVIWIFAGLYLASAVLVMLLKEPA
ncbi:MFS transporter [Allokutzneria oryzae]|uniref:MFS transporter n=1 Tax=Allokutzneria oryzae TaxID=1378989 RepID=A0ABV5ZPZ2_9PSEU